MLTVSWQNRLKQTLRSLSPPDRAVRCVVLGIGNEFNGDDAAGIAVARGLEARVDSDDRLLIVDAGIAPENHTGVLRAFAPDVVLLVDAAQMNAEPGTVRLLDWQDTTGLSATTHTLPPYMLAKFLTMDLGCTVALLGMQPFGNLPDTPLSDPMQAVVEEVVAGLVDALTG
ncbi:MAG: hydrogenase maturation protease [Chloroflexi bacterium]|nr:hydrogenase maturation protease [Chloroflexota bacterium]